MTEYASADKERRGIAVNRWLKALHDLLGWLLLVGFIGHLIGAKIYSKNVCFT